MSQHYFTHKVTEKDHVSILAGWDRPLGQYFLVIEDKSPRSPYEDGIVYASPFGGIIYSNLEDENTPTTDWNYFLGILEKFNIDLPNGFSDAIVNDMKANAGNATRNWDEHHG